MKITVKLINKSEIKHWDNYVLGHPYGHLYHLSGWSNIINESYNHNFYYLAAFKVCPDSKRENKTVNMDKVQIVGVLPLIHIKHFLFGNNFTSVPFFDMGGVLADTVDIERALTQKAIELLKICNSESLELRQTGILKCVHKKKHDNPEQQSISTFSKTSITVNTQKVRMLLDLPESSELLLKSFKSKLRSQIKKPIKEGLTSKFGWEELLDDFYQVFLINMRDLGSPVHSKRLIESVLRLFRKETRVFVVYKGKKPIAASIVIGCKDTLENPWSSSLREYGRLSPNMMLYWEMLKYACDNGFKHFDFGRSTPGEGTFKFKQQWGAQAQQLYWYSISLNGKPTNINIAEKSKFEKLIQYWQKLPVPVSAFIGPKIRKYISL